MLVIRGGTDDGMFGGIHADAGVVIVRAATGIREIETGPDPDGGIGDGLFGGVFGGAEEGEAAGNQAPEGVIGSLPAAGTRTDSTASRSETAIFADEYPIGGAIARHCADSVV